MPRNRDYLNDAEKQRAYRYRKRNIPFELIDGIVVRNSNIPKNTVTQKKSPRITSSNKDYETFYEKIMKTAIQTGSNSYQWKGMCFRKSDLPKIYLWITSFTW